MKPEEIDKRVKEAKEELYRTFADKPNFKYLWKEEDLQSCLYCLLVKKKKIPIKLVHRVYPLLKRLNPPWREAIFGELDLAILDPDPFPDGLNLKECKIRHAIELKFPLIKQEDGKVFCEDTVDGFVREYKKDYEKLSESRWKIENKNEKFFQKHILFFEKFRENKGLFKSCKNCEDIKQRVRKEAKKEANKCIKFDNIKFSYMEVYPNGEHSRLLNNCGLKDEV